MFYYNLSNFISKNSYKKIVIDRKKIIIDNILIKIIINV